MNVAMFKNYMIVAVRNLMRHRVYSVINVLGLAIGMATCILIVRYIQDELSFNGWHTKAERIYRVIRETKGGGESSYLPNTSGALAQALQQDFPEVDKAVRVWPGWTDVSLGGQRFRMDICIADREMFEVFDFPFVKGSLDTAFPNPNAIAITESAAKRLFGDGNPIGRTITVESDHHGGERTITAVLKDVPPNATFQFDYVATAVFSNVARHAWEWWRPTSGWRPVHTYVLLREDAGIEALKEKLPAFLQRHMGAEIGRTNAYHLQPLDRIYLYSRLDYGLDWGGDINRVYQFGASALLVLAIGCINFTNLTTAQSACRSREVGLRKVAGASRAQLMTQLLGESVLTALFALALALIAVRLVLPEFNAFFHKKLQLDFLGDPVLAVTLTIVAVLVGLLAGTYPALFLSAFQPTKTLKGTFHTGRQWIRKGLVVAQFAISTVLIISAGVVYQQLDYIQNKPLGFNMDQMVIVPIFGTDQDEKSLEEQLLADRYVTIKQAFLAHPDAIEATAYRWTLGRDGGIMRTVRAEGHEATDWRMPILEVDEDYIDVFRIGLTLGRKFDPVAFPTDTSSAFVINETAVKQLGWDSPIGRSFEWADQSRNRKGRVIGVVQDFHYNPLRTKIGPAVLTLRSRQFHNLGVRVKPGTMERIIPFFEKTWKQFVPADIRFDYTLWDQQFGNMYSQERRVQSLTVISSGMAILLACMGLFGLAAFTTEQRTKEIGVRKVLGASVSGIVMLISWAFARSVLIANLIAWPVAYYVMRNWLNNFAYRTDLSWWVFIAAGAIVLLTALFTVGYQALRAALSNPVEALRYE